MVTESSMMPLLASCTSSDDWFRSEDGFDLWLGLAFIRTKRLWGPVEPDTAHYIT